MIKTFRSKALRLFWEKGNASKLPVQNPARIRRILDLLDKAGSAREMDVAGFRFHGLGAMQPGRYAVEASGNYRVTFGFEGKDAVGIDLEDYH